MEVERSGHANTSPRRPLAKRLRLAAAAFVALIVIVAVWGRPSRPPTSPRATVIPWSNPAVVTPGIRFVPAPIHPAAAACGSTALTSVPPTDSYIVGGDQHTIETLLVNRGDEPCSVGGQPQLVSVIGGKTSPLITGPQGPAGTRTLARDEGTGIALGFSHRQGCDATDPVTDIAIQWPDGGRTPVTYGFAAPQCFDITVSAWRPTFLAGAIRGFNAKIVAPESVRANESFTYLVDLTNTSDSEGRLEPCPIFSQAFGIAEQRQLPCPASVVEPGQTLSYEMKILAPPPSIGYDGSPRSAVLRWELNDRLGETIALATADITVLP